MHNMLAMLLITISDRKALICAVKEIPGIYVCVCVCVCVAICRRDSLKDRRCDEPITGRYAVGG